MKLFECGYAKYLVFDTVRVFLFVFILWCVVVCKGKEKQCFLRPPKDKSKNDWNSWTFLLVDVRRKETRLQGSSKWYVWALLTACKAQANNLFELHLQV